ncbi:hypothetical protein K8I31_21915, partial [bacterium]|nr:hypothetical protein [bacterium]
MQITTLLRKWTPFLAPILFFAALWVLHRELEHFQYQDVVNQLHQIPIWRITFALLFTFFSYLTLTLFDVLAFRYLKISLPYKITAPISFISYALGNNIGNTLITGGSVRLRMYSSQGIGALDITAVTGFCGLIFWLGFISIAGFSFTLDPPDVLSTAQFHFLSMRWLGLIFLLLTSAYLLMALLLRAPLQIRNVKINPPSGKIALSQIVLGAIDISFAAATLYILLPESVSLSYISFIGVFLLALIAGLISQVPGGYG